MAKTKRHQDSVNAHGLIPLYSIASLPPSFLHMYEYLAKNQGYEQTEENISEARAACALALRKPNVTWLAITRTRLRAWRRYQLSLPT